MIARHIRLTGSRIVRTAALIALAGATTACGGGAHPAPAATPSPRISATPTPAASMTDISSTVSTWFTTVGKSHLMIIQADLTRLGTDVANRDFASLQQHCTSFARPLAATQRDQPIPDAVAESHWAKAVTDFQHAGTACVTAAQHKDTTELQAVVDDIQAGATELKAVTARFTQLGL